ncbi:dual specificity protein kinase yak1 [Actinomortierella ambigua]|nr:dual specificity protein kinase yak1 [Actinomortierella ambigua]
MPPTFPHTGSSPHHVNAGGNIANNTSASSASRSGSSGRSTSPNNIPAHHSHYQYPGNLLHHPNSQVHSQQQQHQQQHSQQHQQHQHQQQHGSRQGVSWSSLTSSTGHVGIPMDDDLQPMQGSLPSFNQQPLYQQHSMHYQPPQHQNMQQRRLPTSKDAEWGSFSPLSAPGPSTATPPFQSYAGMNDKRASHVMVPATSFQPLPTIDHLSSPTVPSSQAFLIPPPPSLQANAMYYHDQQHPPPPQLDPQSPRNVQQHQRHSYAKPYPDHPTSSLYRVEERSSAPASPAQTGLSLSSNSQSTIATSNYPNSHSISNTAMTASGPVAKGVGVGDAAKPTSGEAPPIASESSSPPSSSTSTSVSGSGSTSSNNLPTVPTSVSPRTGVPLVSGRHPVAGVMGLAPSSSSPSRSPVSPVLLQKSSSLRSTRPNGGSSLKENTSGTTTSASTSTTMPSNATLASSALPKGEPVSALSSSPQGSSSLSSATSGMALPAAGGVASGKGGGGGGAGAGSSITGAAPMATSSTSTGSYQHHRGSYQPTQFAQGYQHFATSQGTSSGYLSSGSGLSRHLSIHLPTNPTLLPPPPAMRMGAQQQQQQQPQQQGHHSAYTIDGPEVGSSIGHPRSFTPPAFSLASQGARSSQHAGDDTKQGLNRNGSLGAGGHSTYSIPSSIPSSEGGYAPPGASGFSGASVAHGNNHSSSSSQRFSQVSSAQRQFGTAQSKQPQQQQQQHAPQQQQQQQQPYVPPPLSYQYLSAFGPSYKQATATSGYHNLPRTHRRSIQPLTLEQQQPRGGAFRYVRTQADLWPQRGSQKYRSIDAYGHSISPLRALTTLLTRTYSHCSKDFCYEPSYNPRRVLTKPSKPMHNEGYDNEDYDYILYVGDILGSEERQRYQILDILGQGTFGQVVKCQNLKTNAIVAVKVVKNKPAYFNQSMMEVTVLELLNERYDREDRHHILRLLDTFIHRRHLCLVFELLSVNLYELIKQNQFRGLSMSLVRVFTAQLLDALCVLNEARIIHCDLKPENVLLKNLETPAIKVIDFGSACHEQQTVYTYIQSRFYRSPEVLIGLPYSSSIDIWSVGCIAAELFLGLPLFPGSSEYNQISRIVEMLGMPPTYMLEIGKTAREYFEVVRPSGSSGIHGSGPGGTQRKYRLKSMEQYSREHRVVEQPSKRYFQVTSLPDIIMTYPMMKKNMSQREIDKEMATRQSFINFLQGLLNLNPIERWSPHQAKMHPFITGEVFTGRFVPPSIPRKVITAENSARLEPTMPQNSRAARRASLSNPSVATAPSTTASVRRAGSSSINNPRSGPTSSSTAAAASSQPSASTAGYERGTTVRQGDKVAHQTTTAVGASGLGHAMSESSSESSLGSMLTSTPSSDTYGVGGGSVGGGPHSALSSTTTATTQVAESAPPSSTGSGAAKSFSGAPGKSHVVESRRVLRSHMEDEQDEEYYDDDEDEDDDEDDDENTDESSPDSADDLDEDTQESQGSESDSSSDAVADEMEGLSISHESNKSIDKDAPPTSAVGGAIGVQPIGAEGGVEREGEMDDGAEEEDDALDRLAQNIGWDDILGGSGATSTSGGSSYSQHRPRATTMGTVEVPRTMAQLAAAMTPHGAGPAGAAGAPGEARSGVLPSASRAVHGPIHTGGYRGGGGGTGSSGRGGNNVQHSDAPSEIVVESASTSGARNATMPSPMSSGSATSVGLDRIPEQSENPSPVQDQNPSKLNHPPTLSQKAAATTATSAAAAASATGATAAASAAGRGPGSQHSGAPPVNRRGFLVRSGSDITGILSLISSPGGLGTSGFRSNRADGAQTTQAQAGRANATGEAEAAGFVAKPEMPGSQHQPSSPALPPPPPQDNLTPLQRMQQQLRQSQSASAQYQQQRRYHFGYPQSGSSHSGLSSSDEEDSDDDDGDKDDGHDEGKVDKEEDGEEEGSGDGQVAKEKEVVVSVHEDEQRDDPQSRSGHV